MNGRKVYIIKFLNYLAKIFLKYFFQLTYGNTELGGVQFSKLLDGKGPSVKSRSETDGGIGRIDTDDTHGTVVISIGGNDDVDVLNDTLESKEEIFLLQLEFQQSTVHLVHEKNGLDTFGDGLTQDSLGLHTDTYGKNCNSL